MRDPYQTLGVARTATSDEIKKAYRKLAKEHHPDRKPDAPGNEERFKEVSAAYAILSDPEKRARYDRGEIDAGGAERTHRDPRAGARAYSARARAGGTSSAGDDGFSFSAEDFFHDMFGRRRSGSAGTGGASGGSAGGAGAQSGPKVRGADIAYSVAVPFLEAAQGTRRRISLSHGKSLDVNIPPGTENEQKLRLKGQGLPGLGGAEAGDAIVEVLVDPHPFFTRQDGDIHLEVPITLNEAVLGSTIRVPTVTGPVAVKVPPGSNTGSILRLRGKGVVSQKTKQTGDQYVKLKVVLPDPPDSELVRFIEDWARTRSYDVRKKAGLE
ncbi:J domain-containing protein [Azospirillum sp. RWY-5-1]|uniref:J domain-containing protein n=1 Tax=Azospirillum oleiclasticum TaxID=2735135 RepID=A0ABX2T533_9PROT|nr:J domain-containing protein [Azospirillum oleiclasticum]NYZ11251.1 J domain-containing protein [Azospirillum oleiclasticum]NYZ18412.1 J domain-containing protein [Azospirillum oleiclasticum]